MNSRHPTTSTLLRNALQGNALFSAISGLILLAAARPVAVFTGIPWPQVLMATGIVLVGYAAVLLVNARRHRIDPNFARLAIVLDVLWVVGSVALLAADLAPLTTAGKWTIALLAEAVAAFAFLQTWGLRRQTA